MLDTDFIPAVEKESRRLMIMIHGLGDSMEGYRWAPHALQLPWLNYLLVNAPDPYYGGFAWYDLQDPGSGIERSRKLLFELLDDLAGKDFPTESTTLFGFSQGCLMSIEMGTRYKQCFAGIVGISGYAFEPEKLVMQLAPEAKSQRFLLTHGTQDTLIPIERVRPQIEILRRGGLQIEWREFEKGHTIAGEAEMAVIRDFVRHSYA